VKKRILTIAALAAAIAVVLAAAFIMLNYFRTGYLP
jgi:hypothetical protein